VHSRSAPGVAFCSPDRRWQAVSAAPKTLYGHGTGNALRPGSLFTAHGELMLDVLLILTTFVFFGVAGAYVHACARL
jgi:hypothetical protein